MLLMLLFFGMDSRIVSCVNVVSGLGTRKRLYCLHACEDIQMLSDQKSGSTIYHVTAGSSSRGVEGSVWSEGGR